MPSRGSSLPPLLRSPSTLAAVPSDMSIHDTEVAALTAPTGSAASTKPATMTSAQEKQKLGRDLLDALSLGTSNFFLAYNTRAGIAVLLRIFKLLQKKNYAALFDLKQLMDEKHLAFRVDAVSLGLFVGWFTGGYRGMRALLPVLLRRLLAKKTDAKDKEERERRIKALSALGAGAVAAGSILFVDAKRRQSFALYALTRALQCAYNTAKGRGYWHFWGSDWKYGDSLLFALAGAQVMYAFIIRPTTLPSEYFRFIKKTGPVEKEMLDLVRENNRSLPLDTAKMQALFTRMRMTMDFPVPEGPVPDILPCRMIHCEDSSCAMGVVTCFRNAFKGSFPLYLSLFIVPNVVINFKKFLMRPGKTLFYSVLNATRSNSFLASFVSLYLALACLQRRLVTKDHRFYYYLFGLGASTTILMEPKSRRSELALYVLPRALDSLYMILRDRGIFTGIAHGDVLLFSASMAVMMYCYEHENAAVAPFVSKTLKRFLETSTDKKKQYLTSLEKKLSTKNNGSTNGSTTTTQQPI